MDTDEPYGIQSKVSTRMEVERVLMNKESVAQRIK